jgi:hypothetical protein
MADRFDTPTGEPARPFDPGEIRCQFLADVRAMLEAERLADWAPVVASPVRR